MAQLMRLLGILSVICLASADECGECNRSECPVLECLNFRRDSCDCCLVCLQDESEPCDLPNNPYKYGDCGDYMTCVPRKGDDKVGTCTCTQQDVICGSNGVTYDNLCQLSQDSKRLEDESIIVKSFGKCKTTPVILSGPPDIQNGTGANVAMICEATGYPIPYILWVFTRADGTTLNLPGDDIAVSMNLRGGPEKDQVTGWLQVMNVTKKIHEGDYTCIAKNSEGDVTATARLKVVETIDLQEGTRSST